MCCSILPWKIISKKNIVLLNAKGSIFWPTRRSVSDVVISYYCLPFYSYAQSSEVLCLLAILAKLQHTADETFVLPNSARLHITCYSKIKEPIWLRNTNFMKYELSISKQLAITSGWCWSFMVSELDHSKRAEISNN